MTLPARRPWARAAIIAGLLYFAAGSGSAAIDPYIPETLRFAWRLSSWIASAVVFAIHIRFELVRLRSRTVALALHAAAGAAIGGFLIAAAATVRAALLAGGLPSLNYLLALVLFPLVTAVPAFVAALVVGAAVIRVSAGRIVGARN